MAELYPAPQWFAIRTRSRAEQTVANRLAAQGIETFLPRYFESVVWSDRSNETVRILFPCYLFAQFADVRQSKMAVRTAGVIQVLGHNGPEAVDSQQIESIRIACESGLNLQPCQYRTGEVVTILSGPFQGCEGVVDVMKKNRLILRVDMLNRGVSIEIDKQTRIERKR